jgi:hypothetical protein
MWRVEFAGKRLVPLPMGGWTLEDIRVIVWVDDGKVYVERMLPSTGVRAVWGVTMPNNLNVSPEPPSSHYPNLPKHNDMEAIGGLVPDGHPLILAPIGTFDKILTKIYGYVAHM